jgi:alpha-tubulin suppressor-like RCC1 family protein
VGGYHNCAIDDVGAVSCWGKDDYGQTSSTPVLAFAQVSSGLYHNCGIASDGSIACWGWDDKGQVTSAP